jgi:serine/threonine protein kinase
MTQAVQVSSNLQFEAHLRGRYTVERPLGAGGNGQVFLATQQSTGQHVAIKLLNLALRTAEHRDRSLARFRREIGICSSLYHPDIVRVLDSGSVDEHQHYAVFEYVPGSSLGTLLREQGALTVERTVGLLTQLLPALAYAHERGIVHRDLKPANVMVTHDGVRERLKILDFGIGAMTPFGGEHLERLTLSHEWVGTPHYVAPEQLRGHPTDAKADLYAWGLMLVECMTGTPLVSGLSLGEIIDAHLRPRPHVLPEGLGAHRLGALLARVLEKNPLRRVGDASALLQLLERIDLRELCDAHGYLRDSARRSGVVPRALPADPTPTPEQQDRLEVRQATVVCCRLIMPPRIGPRSVEDDDTLLDDASSLAEEVLALYGASVIQRFAGHTIAYFGLAPSRAADGHVAARAALELLQRLDATPLGPRSETRALRPQLGIHSGPVTQLRSTSQRRVLDGLSASVALGLVHGPHVPSDDAPHVWLSEDYARLVARRCELVSAPQRAAADPGTAPALVYELIGESRVSGLSSSALRFVGRTDEIAHLEAAATRARAVRGEAVFVRGDAGLGKSRLCSELLSCAGISESACIVLRCLPEWEHAQLRPLVEPVRTLLGLNEAPAATRGSWLSRLGALVSMSSEAQALVADWLGLPRPESTPLSLSPPKQRRLLLAAISDVLSASAARGSVLLVEDLHWADPSTAECIAAVLPKLAANLGFALITSRNAPPFAVDAPHSTLVLEALDPHSARQLAVEAVARAGIAGSAADGVVARSDGIPLFVEELVEMLREHAPVGDATLASDPVLVTLGNAVPQSLHELLTRRLDDAGEARGTAQFASAVGREFTMRELVDLSGRDEVILLAELEELTARRVLTKRLQVQGTVYAFRHALIRDAAHASLVRAEARAVHSQIATRLLARRAAGELVASDRLAQHFEAAGELEQARHFWSEAGAKSLRSHAYLEAAQEYGRALAALGPPSGPESKRAAAELELAQAGAFVQKFGYTHPSAVAAYRRAAELVSELPHEDDLAFSAVWGQWYASQTGAQLEQAAALTEQLSQLSERTGMSAHRVSAYVAACETNMARGRLAESVSAARGCSATYVFAEHSGLTYIRGDDPLLASLSFESFSELLRGRADVALQRMEEAFSLAERLGSPHLSAGIEAQAAWLHLIWGSSGAAAPELARAHQHAAASIAIAQQQDFIFWVTYAAMIDASARITEGDTAAADELLGTSAIWSSVGAALGRCWHLAYASEAFARSGDFERAHALLREGIAHCAASDSRFFEPELLRREALLWLDERNAARDAHKGYLCLERAATLAAQHGHGWWELAVEHTRQRALPEAQRDAARLCQCLASVGDLVNEPPLVREARALVADLAARAHAG